MYFAFTMTYSVGGGAASGCDDRADIPRAVSQPTNGMDTVATNCRPMLCVPNHLAKLPRWPPDPTPPTDGQRLANTVTPLHRGETEVATLV